MPRERTERRSTREVTHVVWSRVKAWFVAPFSPRVEQRVPAIPTRVAQRVVTNGTCVPSHRAPADVPLETQASAFLKWLQESPGSTGDMFPRDLIELYRYFCIQRNWQSHYWQRVAHELALLIGEGSRVTWVDGKKQRMWRIPPAPRQRMVARVTEPVEFMPHVRKRVLGPMATHVEAA